MACRLQKLFGADGDLADEDFLSAVEDAENQFTAPAPIHGPHPAPGQQPLHPLGPQLSYRSGNPPSLRPLTRQGEQPMGCQGALARGAAPQDELDNDLFLAACMELEGPELPAGTGAAWPGPGRWEKPPQTHTGQESPQERAAPKKLRVGEELVSPGSRGVEGRQDPLPTPQAAPKLVLRPSTASACPPGPPTPLGKPGGLCGFVPTPGGPALRPFQASPCQPGASGSSVGLRMPRTPMAQAPRQSYPLPQRPPTNPPALMSCVEPVPRQPPRPALPSLQTPVVTNHLVQLVTAASKAPGATPRLPPQGKTRRFPGPAGILPQQHTGKLLEEILVSAPQTPAHGAVAKTRTEGLPSSSPPTEEDFGKGPWLAMKMELGLDERDPSCFLRTYSVVMVLRKAVLKQLPRNKVPSMAVMIKTLTRTNVDAGAVFRDPTGEMQGTVHRLLLEERQSELKPGSVLLLKQVGVFSPSHRNHYLNVTPNNLLKIYPLEPEGSFSQPLPAQEEVPAQAELLRDHPAQPPQGVPASGDWGQLRMGSHSAEQSPGGFSLHPQSPRPRREEPVGADGCDMGELGLLEVGRKSSMSHGKQMTWTGSWGSCLRTSSLLRPKLTAADMAVGPGRRLLLAQSGLHRGLAQEAARWPSSPPGVSMAQETFAFSSSALRSLRLQQELLEQEDRRRALARESATRRFLSSSPRPPLTPSRRPQYCRDPAIHNALYTGDLLRIKSIFKDETTTNMIMETASEELVWSPEQAGLWVLSPRRQQTSALRIAASRGYSDCARHLLLRGAVVDAVVGGRAPLHDSVAAPRPDCARLLLAFGADPNLLNAEGLAPLHLCTAPDSLLCAELLLAHGARVNLGTRDQQLTALHVAARQGLVAHVELYLHHGADPSCRTRQGETPLNAACAAAERPEEAERYYRVAERLLAAGANPGAAGRKDHTPLHNACGNGQPRLAQLLLRHGADATVPNCAGYTPMDCALHAVEEYRHQRPEETIALLLNHGAGPVHPKMLKFCCRHPPALEMVLNAYDRIPPAESWVGSVPLELWEEHQEFYASAQHMASTPRRLQHLARCAVRRHLGARCHLAVPKLALPASLRHYLQLPLTGVIS
ncbi:uncharacterized protein FN964_014042 isoform 3-T4 [Alca torda]